MSRKFLNCGHAAGASPPGPQKGHLPPAREGQRVPQPPALRSAQGRTAVLRAGSDAMSSVCRALLPGDSHHMWEAAGHWAASPALPGRTDSNPALTLAAH